MDTPRGGSNSLNTNSAKNSAKRSSGKILSSSSIGLSESERGRMAEAATLSTKLMFVNGRFKSKAELKHEFISADVLTKIKRASKSLSRDERSTPHFDLTLKDALAKPAKRESGKMIQVEPIAAGSNELRAPSQRISIEDTEMSDIVSETADIEQ